MRIACKTKRFLGDRINIINCTAALRERFSRVFLLESSDYHARENSTTLICFDVLGEFSLEDGVASVTFNGKKEQWSVQNDISEKIHDFMNCFHISGAEEQCNGIFGYCGFDSVSYFDTHILQGDSRDQIPEMHYTFFRYILSINPFDNECILVENCPEAEASRIDEISEYLHGASVYSGQFSRRGQEYSTMTDTEFMDLVTKGKEHCQRGDVFQIVLSRRFSQPFTGDDFQVYRALRSVNPSPYLFYFDFGDFRIMGSSPEAEVLVKDQEAELHPIAGTYRRSGDDEYDKQRALELSADPKESSEHVMLVDLARNDMSRHCKNVTVRRFKEIQYFSHVIHLVSRVCGTLNTPHSAVSVLGDTFPAGTLSGAPKYRAVELIDQYEPHRRGYYGGALGYISFSGDVNHAITIRSFLSSKNVLEYQAGAGVVISSREEGELDEVNNKLAALKRAIMIAEELP